jgi:hypothetical protein
MFLQNSLLAILQRLHCSSTHHYFALDALPLVQTSSGMRLVKVLLRHHKRYLSGATDPDTRFRDFQNHVIHVKDGYWGGAPRMAHKWYDRMQRYLRTNRFSDAAHAAGVLSHYFTDPFQPLHTEHSELEKVLHRPIEQSIYRAYSEIFKIWRESEMEVVFQLSNQATWLGESMLHGSRYANRKCDVLLDQYDLMSAVENPQTGLHVNAKNSLAELFGLAITGWARVLERAAEEAELERGKKISFQLTSPAILTAAVRGPFGLLHRHLDNRREQKQIMLMIDEYGNQGKLSRNIPGEVDIVHRVADIYQSEKQWQPPNSNGQTKVAVNGTRDTDQGVERKLLESSDVRTLVEELAVADSIFAAPSINARDAERLIEVGIQCVDDLLHCSPCDIAQRMNSDAVSAKLITAWQSQASLMVNVRGLGEQASKLLVAAGYTSAESIALTQRVSLHREIREVVADLGGEQCLQSGLYPRISEINSWVALASAHVDFSQRKSA